MNLSEILVSYSAPITEQHAWALIFQAMKCLLCTVHRHQARFTPSKSNHILINKIGDVHDATFTRYATEKREMKSTAECTAELGVIVFDALNYKFSNEEERNLSQELENLLDLMTSADDDDTEMNTSDEGIDCGREIAEDLSLIGRVLSMCRHHLPVDEEADNHYRAVCRALVSEALELCSFITRMSSESSMDKHLQDELRELEMNDWASLWTSVMDQLRVGVRLKKVEYNKRPTEYEMTPYEMLMCDIKSRRYKLKQVEIPARVRRDAREVILEFIRSRPPLRSANERELKPLRRESTPGELLMQDIRSDKARQLLRRTPRRRTPPLDITLAATTNAATVNRSTAAVAEEKVNKKIIDLDESLIKDMLDFEEDFSNTSQDEITPSSSPNQEEKSTKTRKTPPPRDVTDCTDRVTGVNRRSSLNSGTYNNGSSRKNSTDGFGGTNSTQSVRKLGATRRGSQSRLINNYTGRRHTAASIASFDTPVRGSASCVRSPGGRRSLDNTCAVTVRQMAGNATLEKRRRASSSSNKSYQTKLDKCVPILSPLTKQKDDFNDHSSVKAQKDWAFIKNLDSLDLSIEELAHIRCQLTKAELEDKSVGNDLYKDLESGRICFVCEKIRFGVFSWASVCTLCSRYVCSKCTTKIKLPGDHLRDIPVSLLTSQLLSAAQPEPEYENSLIRRMSTQLGISSSPSKTSSQVKSRQPAPLYRQSTSPNLKERSSSSASSVSSTSTLSRNGWNRSSLRSMPFQHNQKMINRSQPVVSNQRVKLVRAKTMGKSDVERIKSMKLSQPGTMHTVCTHCRSILTYIVRAKQESEELSKIKSCLASFQEEL